MFTRLFLGIVLLAPFAAFASGATAQPTNRGAIAVGPEYDTTHVYVAPENLDALVNTFVATFGGSASKRSVGNVPPFPAVPRCSSC